MYMHFLTQHNRRPEMAAAPLPSFLPDFCHPAKIRTSFDAVALLLLYLETFESLDPSPHFTRPFKLSSSLADPLCTSSPRLFNDVEDGKLMPSHPASSRTFSHRVVLQPFPSGAGRECLGEDYRAGEMGS